MGRVAAVLSVLMLVVVLVGCGGAGGGNPPPLNGAGEVRGRIDGVADPTQYRLTVDGQPVAARPNASGEFVIGGLPPGQHVIGVVGGNGMTGGYCPVTVDDTDPTIIDDPIVPTLGGAISGIVTKVNEDGSEEVVEGVEVIATAAIMWAPDAGAQAEPVPIGRDNGDPDQLVISAFTNENGVYVMEAVPSGSYDVSVVVPGYDPQIAWVWVDPGRMTTANFTVYPAPEQGVGTVEGLVTGEGAALEGALITVTTGRPWPIPLTVDGLESWLDSRPPSGGTDPGLPICTDPNAGCVVPPWIEVQVFSTLSNAAGHYSLNVPIGTHFIECWLDGYDWQGQDVTVQKDQTTTVDFNLVPWTDPGPVEPPIPGDPGDPGDPGNPGDPGDPTDPVEPNK